MNRLALAVLLALPASAGAADFNPPCTAASCLAHVTIVAAPAGVSPTVCVALERVDAPGVQVCKVDAIAGPGTLAVNIPEPVRPATLRAYAYAGLGCVGLKSPASLDAAQFPVPLLPPLAPALGP